MNRCWLRASVAALSLLLVGCGSGGAEQGGSPDRASTPITLKVFAASSLRAVFGELERSFEDAHETVDVEVTTGGSAALAAQIRQGAPAHVLVTADEDTMRLVVPDDVMPRPTVIARNRLAIVVEPGNPERVASMHDLARRDLVVVLCAPAVPCGRLALAALEAEGVIVEASSLEQNVGGVRAKVELGEADAGIVYATEARAAGDALTQVHDPRFDDAALEACYPMAVLAGAPRPEADAWVDHVRSQAARAVLRRAGFLAP